MKHLILLLSSFLVFTGCTEPGSSLSNADRQQDSPPFDPTKMVTVEEIRPAMQNSERPTSAEQLRGDFVSLVEIDPEKALIDFIDWDAVPESKQQEKLAGLLKLPYANDREKRLKLLDSRLYSISEYSNLTGCPVSEYNKGRVIPVTHVLELEYKFSENGRRIGKLYAGVREDRFYLYPDTD